MADEKQAPAPTSPPAIQYWNFNIPKDEWTAECPEYLQGVDAFDTTQLGTKDEDYKLMTWSQVHNIISIFSSSGSQAPANTVPEANRLEQFKRIPSDLRRYRKYVADIKQQHGSVMNFILKHRVRWQDLTPRDAPFEDPSTSTHANPPFHIYLFSLLADLVITPKLTFVSFVTTGRTA
jgi:hypothetical protein